MPWSGSAPNQSFTRTDGTRTGDTVWAEAKTAGVKIVADGHDTHDTDLGDAIDACLKKDGGNTATANIPMGNFKITALGDATGATDALNRQTADARYVQLGTIYIPPGGRLSIATGVPVMTSTVSGATSHYYVPTVGRQVMLYDGTNFVHHDFGGELSQTTSDNTKSPAAVAADKNYDIFVWLDSSTYRATRGPAWSSSTSRGTGAGTSELELLEGIYVNKVAITNGPAAQRGTYVGTIRSNGSSQLDWTYGTVAAGGGEAKLGVWNMYNRRGVATFVGDSTDSWTYGTAAWRAANNSSTYRVSYVCGVVEDMVQASYNTHFNSGAGSPACGIGVDSTTAFSGSTGTVATSTFDQAIAAYSGAPGNGWRFVSAIEYVATSTSTNYGDLGLAYGQNGLHFTGMF